MSNLLYKPVRFYNFTDTDFTYTWDRVEYNFPSQKPIYMELWKAQHFAKHLVDKVLNEKKLPTNHFSRQQLIDQCVILDGLLDIENQEKSKTVIENLNRADEIEQKKVFCDSCDSKGVKHKKDCQKFKRPVPPIPNE